MTPTRLRALMRRHGNLGVLIVACLLGGHYVWTKRRPFLIAFVCAVCLTGAMLWHPTWQSVHSPEQGTELMVDPGRLIPIQESTEVSLKDLPDFSTYNFSTYKVDPYLRAASALQNIGKESAIRKLQTLAQHNNPMDQSVIILCRMLFTQKCEAEFRRPYIGAAGFLSGNYSDWPLEPIEMVEGVPFLITNGYDIEGQPESSRMYLEYCIHHCDWNRARIEPKSLEEKEQALERLLASPKLKAADARKFLAAQIR